MSDKSYTVTSVGFRLREAASGEDYIVTLDHEHDGSPFVQVADAADLTLRIPIRLVAPLVSAMLEVAKEATDGE